MGALLKPCNGPGREIIRDVPPRPPDYCPVHGRDTDSALPGHLAVRDAAAGAPPHLGDEVTGLAIYHAAHSSLVAPGCRDRRVRALTGGPFIEPPFNQVLMPPRCAHRTGCSVSGRTTEWTASGQHRVGDRQQPGGACSGWRRGVLGSVVDVANAG